jgi:hypothetical protein
LINVSNCQDEIIRLTYARASDPNSGYRPSARTSKGSDASNTEIDEIGTWRSRQLNMQLGFRATVGINTLY